MSRCRRAAGPHFSPACVAALVLALAAAAPAPVSGNAELPTLAPLPEPALAGVDPAVAEQLRGLRSEIESTLAAGSGTSAELAGKLGELGGLYYIYGFTDAAEAALGNASALDREDFRWSYLPALVSRKVGDLERAAGGFEDALALRPTYVPALVHLGEVRHDQQRLDDAEDLFRRALAVHPTCAAARFGLGRVQAERGDFAAAAEHFAAVLELQPDASSVHYPLAQAYRQLGRLDDAKAQLAAIGPGEVALPDPVLLALHDLATGSSIHFVRGNHALRRGDTTAAVAELRQAKAADPTSIPIRRVLGLALHQSGQLADAIAEYRAAVDLEPANPLNHHHLATALLDADSDTTNAEAAEHFRRALDLDPTFADALVGLAIAIRRSGRLGEAVPYLDRALEHDPRSRSALFERAMARLRLGRRQGAIDDLRTLVAVDPEDLGARVRLAALLDESGDSDGAAREAAAALELEPPASLAARAQLILGLTAERRGAPSRAAEHYASAAALDANLPLAHFRLASVLAATGDLAGAAASYASGLAIAPDYQPARLALASALIRSGRDAGARERLIEGMNDGRPARREGPDPALARALACLLAGSADAAVRDAAQGLELARVAHAAAPDVLTEQILALALAANGRFAEAADAQGRVVAALQRAGRTGLLAAAHRRLTLYRRGEPAPAPWRDDPQILDPVTLPLPPSDAHPESES